MVKIPNWQEADQLAIYKRGRGVELGATEKQLLLAVRAGLESGASGLQTQMQDRTQMQNLRFLLWPCENHKIYKFNLLFPISYLNLI